MKMLEEDCEEYRDKIVHLAYLHLCIYPCAKCGSPVADGYNCYFCNNAKPHESDDDPKGGYY